MLHYRPLGAYLYVAVILGSLSVFAHIIDPRFPDYIVDPLVDCPTDGYFTHPRNCSWFYRCHDSENTIGFYRRDYFECAPGTIHSQGIEICLNGTWDNCGEIEIETEGPTVRMIPEVVEPELLLDCAKCDYANFEGCSEFNVCPDANDRSKNVSLWLCSSASYSCKTCSHLTPCKENEWISSNPPLRRNPWVQRLSASSKCYPNPYSPEMQCLTTPPKCDDCIITKNQCRDCDACPDGVNRAKMNLCKTAIRTCESCKNYQNVCLEGLYNSQDEQCFPDPSIKSFSVSLWKVLNALLLVTSTLQCPVETTKAPCISTDCQVSTSSCSNFVFACSGGKSQGNLTICTSAYNACPSCNIDKVICPRGYYYAVEDATCYSSHEEITLKKCPSPVPPTPPPTSACDECYISTSRCLPYYVCPEGSAKTTMTLCTTAKRQCYPCESEENVCARGQFYSMENGLCFENPDSSSMKCSPGHKENELPTPLKRDSPEVHLKVNVNRDSVIQCSSENLVPKYQWIKEKFCHHYRPCLFNFEIPTHSGIIELCTGFYQCVLSSTDYSWRAVKSKCEGNKLFSYDGEACINEPRDLCRIY